MAGSDTAVHYRRPQSGDRLGEWILAEPLGENEAGEVWRARHRTLDRPATVTVATDPAQAAVLRTSGTAHQRVTDDRVVHTLGLEIEAQPPYLVLEWVAGRSVRELLAGGALPWGQALAIVREVLLGLAAAHAKRVVHGALRPARILLPEAASGGAVKLTGFGTPSGAREGDDAVVVSDVLDPEGLRRARELEYVAPELRRGGAPTVAGDIYAVGVIGYELCTGDLPHGSESAAEVQPAVPAAFADVLRKAYGRAELRYASANAMVAALPRGAGDARRVPQAVPVAFPSARPAARIRIGASGEVEEAAEITFTGGRAQCSGCSHVNPLGHKYCTRCGKALHAGTAETRACPKCRTTAPAHHRFCPRCGVSLDGTG